MKDKYLSSEHLILALFDNTNTLIKEILRTFHLEKKTIEKIIMEMRDGEMVDSKNKEDTYEVLAKYGRDLVDLVSKGKIDPVIFSLST